MRRPEFAQVPRRRGQFSRPSSRALRHRRTGTRSSGAAMAGTLSGHGAPAGVLMLIAPFVRGQAGCTERPLDCLGESPRLDVPGVLLLIATPSRHWPSSALRVAARVQERYMRNNCGEERIDARGNPEPGRGNQAVCAAAEEASLTSTPRPDVSPNLASN